MKTLLLLLYIAELIAIAFSLIEIAFLLESLFEPSSSLFEPPSPPAALGYPSPTWVHWNCTLRLLLASQVKFLVND